MEHDIHEAKISKEIADKFFVENDLMGAMAKLEWSIIELGIKIENNPLIGSKILSILGKVDLPNGSTQREMKTFHNLLLV